jgi:hypothetical protein
VQDISWNPQTDQQLIYKNQAFVAYQPADTLPKSLAGQVYNFSVSTKSNSGTGDTLNRRQSL